MTARGLFYYESHACLFCICSGFQIISLGWRIMGNKTRVFGYGMHRVHVFGPLVYSFCLLLLLLWLPLNVAIIWEDSQSFAKWFTVTLRKMDMKYNPSLKHFGFDFLKIFVKKGEVMDN
jgi:hypothetical protein